MAKLTSYVTPTGMKGDLLNPTGIFQLVLGTVVLIFAIATGQNLAKKVNGKVPFLDTSIEKPYKNEIAVKQENKKRVL
jgi:hypothetical protein